MLISIIIIIVLSLLGLYFYKVKINKKQLKNTNVKDYLTNKKNKFEIVSDTRNEYALTNIVVNSEFIQSRSDVPDSVGSGVGQLTKSDSLSTLVKNLPVSIDLIRNSENDLNKIVHKDDYLYPLISSLKAWRPRCGKEAVESDYHESLERFFKKNCPQLKIERECFVDSRNENVRRRVDFVINKNIILEIKKTLNKVNEVDRAYGQLFSYSQSLPVILIICETHENFSEKHGLDKKILELRNNGCSVVAIAAGKRLTN